MTAPGGRRKAAATLRLALFAEGATYSDIRGREELSALWRRLCELCGAVAPVQVVGFSKSQLRKMEHRPEIRDSGTQALDLLVAQHHELIPFDRAIIAFDAFPENQEVVPKGCQHEEIDFVLRHFAASGRLPSALRQAAQQLRAHYATAAAKRTKRVPGALEILYMRPNFEGLLVSDEPTVKRALVGYGARTPPEWPTFDLANRNPDQSILQKAIECASPNARRTVRGKFKENKHGWGEYILRHAQAESKLLRHPTAARLGLIAGR